ncbi:MAG TPA: hypothetical protein PLT04_04635 [Candidatus Saccharibacteria bacterium]|jgi:hypothetical protein|nr:hypothetical protein [Candidatus Saccharibacteria bacterium]
MTFLHKLFGIISPKSAAERRSDAYSEALREEAKVGGRLFGPVPDGVIREFFCLDAHTWIWHEEWTDENNKYHIKTTRYDIRPSGVFKAQDGLPYRPIGEAEAYNLFQATARYNQAIDAELDPILAANGVAV